MERQGPEWNALWCVTRLKRPTSGAGHGGRGGHHSPFGPKMIFNYPERTGVLPYRDTESQFPPDHLTIASPSGRPEERRRLAAYPAVHSASAAMIERRWITTREASRIVAVTEAGLRDWPGVDLAQLRSAA